MLFEGFLQGIMNYLGVPQGVLLRKNYGVNGNTNSNFDITANDYISTILDITVDDICIGDSPLTYTCSETTPDSVRNATNQICDEFNKIMKWTARDLCQQGFSLYTASVKKMSSDEIERSDENSIQEKLLLLPFLDSVRFYMNNDGEIIVYNDDEKSTVNLDNVVLFINYDKTCLTKLDKDRVDFKIDDSIIFEVTPLPMQLKKIAGAVKSLGMCESALLRYRTQMSRIARFINVDVGTSQGDQADDVSDAISSAINADSLSLMTSDDAMLYNDAIPVIPNRRGLGKPELVTDIPQYDLKDLGDIDYFLSKVTLLAKFPATYIDFTKVLDSGVATTIKGDIRYSKLCKSVRSVINNTINKYVGSSKNFAQYEVTFLLNSAPDSEDADRNTALSDITQITDDMHRFVLGEGDGDVKSMRTRLALLQTMVGNKCITEEVSEFFRVENEYLDEMESDMESSGFDTMMLGENDGEGLGGGVSRPRPTMNAPMGGQRGESAPTEPTVKETTVSSGDTVETFPLGANE